MIQFLAPLWLLALPLAILPWFFPVFHKPQRQAYLFSAFLLLPDRTQRKRFLFSLEGFILKLLRSLIIILICVILARPYWQEEGSQVTVWVIDDTFSRTLLRPGETLNPLRDMESTLMNQTVWKLSELYLKSPHAPSQSREAWNNLTTASPNLSVIGNLIHQKLGEENTIEKLKVHLISDFQRTQYEFYQTASPNIEWVFQRATEEEIVANLSLREIQITNMDLFEFKLRAEIYGNAPENHPLRVEVLQKGNVIGANTDPWQGENSQIIEIQLTDDFQRHQPVEITLHEDAPGIILDNTRFYQENHTQHFWVSLVTSEGNLGIYRHGLHQLKSALNANQTFAFLSDTLQDLQQHHPDILLLLGDHPARWIDALKDYPSKLFIPTRLGDWKAIASQGDPTSEQIPKMQWMIDWTRTPFAQEGNIQKFNEYLFYSPTWNLWLLATGVSPAWGPLYKDVVFADQVQTWMMTLLAKAPHQYLGTLEIGQAAMKNIVPEALSYHWAPGHYQIYNQEEERTYHFSLNLPSNESQPELLTAEQLDHMQAYFSQHTADFQKQSATPEVNQLREWLLWGLWGLVLLEILYLIIRLIKKSWRGYGKYSFY